MKEYAEPRMHTAEHLLNWSMVRLFGCGRAFSSHIERKRSKCDFRFNRALTAAETAELEKRVNAAGKLDLGRLPEGAEDPLRVISIGDYDACPCGGKHVASTAVIGVFRIISSSFAEGILRVRFRLDQPAVS